MNNHKLVVVDRAFETLAEVNLISYFLCLYKDKEKPNIFWNDSIDRLLFTGPAYSFISFIQKQ